MHREKGFVAIIVIALIAIAAPVVAQDYVGQEACQACHSGIYGDYIQSGHPYKLNKVVDGQPPEYPFTVAPNPPEGYTWDDITYVIGGYNWKARFIDTEGFIITGDKVQYNFFTQDYGSYHADEAVGTKPYNCGKCHTTGWQSVDDNGGARQDDLPGMAGTFAAPGIQCEACHGPGSDHAAAPSSDNITVDTSKELCGQCHTRDAERRIAASGGFIKHHEQYDEIVNSPHRFMDCGQCHDPHKSVVNNLGGTTEGANCTTCHADAVIRVASMADHSCESCHMPLASKSATPTVEYIRNTESGDTGILGDIQSHTFKLNTDPDIEMFTEDGSLVRLDDEGDAIVRVEFACAGCHNGTVAPQENVDWMYANAGIVHRGGATAVEALASIGTPDEFVLHAAFPNPFNPNTNIRYDLAQTAAVRFEVRDVRGALVAVLVDELQMPGRYLATWDATDVEGRPVASGIYFGQLTTGTESRQVRMTLVR